MSIATLGIDLGKTSMHIVGLDASGKPVHRKKLTRTALIRFLSNWRRVGSP
ncbi:hypothetical protein [Guyparkeria halophila]|uniref:hypothetical protein n=1 Tax=Guyparkeria halophila TaxID=47960 RepID=UPI0018CC4DEB|nr:hypothetical protein [Guyparkeria halophila]